MNCFVSRPLAAIFLLLSCVLLASTVCAEEHSPLPDVGSWTPLDHLTPYGAGPGIVVCDPVPQEGSRDLASLGIGCSRWLQLELGSQPELEQTPAWSDLDRARKELKKPDLSLASSEATSLPGITGATHIMVGAIHGSSTSCSLTYDLLAAPDLHPVAHLEASGAPTQVVAALPQLARTALSKMGLPVGRLPASAGVLTQDLAFLGRLAWRDGDPLPHEDLARLVALSKTVPLAGMLYLSQKVSQREETSLEPFASRLLTQAPGSPIVLCQAAEIGGLANEGKLEQALQHHPHNFLMASADWEIHWESGETTPMRQAAERLVRCAPNNPVAWERLSLAGVRMSDQVRQGRAWGLLSKEEADFLTRLYAEDEQALMKATALDPHYTGAWYHLSTEAAALGHRDTADKALWKAMEQKGDQDIYYWGLQLFQPKWFPDKAKLEQVARLAAGDQSLSLSGAEAVAEELKKTGFGSLTSGLLNRLIAHYRSILKGESTNSEVREKLADALRDAGDLPASILQFRTLLKADPKDPGAHYKLAGVLADHNDYQEAVREFREALRLKPDYEEARFQLSGVLMDRGQLKEAEAEARKGLQLDPKNADFHYDLGESLRRQEHYDEAIKELVEAARLSPYWGPPYTAMCAILTVRGDFANAAKYGAVGVRLNLYTGRPHAYLAQALAGGGHVDEAIIEYREALRLDPADARVHLDLGKALAARGAREEAQAEWRRVLELDKGAPAEEARKLLGKP